MPTDVEREIKELAGRFVQAITTYARGVDPDDHTTGVATQFGVDPTGELRALITEVTDPEAQSVGRIIYPQLGGLRPDAASVMVQVSQEMSSAVEAIRVETRVFDVRLERLDGTWRVAFLASNGGPPVPRPAQLSDAARRVLDHPNIELADSSRWDIHRGHTTDEMLVRMAEVADLVPISVLVLNSGHPVNVFATDRVSRHSVGDAMDVYAVDGQLVVDSRFEGSPAWTLARRLFDEGTRSLGSPWAFDGFGGRSFTDAVHQDHLHIISD